MTNLLIAISVVGIMGFVVISAVYVHELRWERRERMKYMSARARRNGWTVIEAEAKRW